MGPHSQVRGAQIGSKRRTAARSSPLAMTAGSFGALLPLCKPHAASATAHADDARWLQLRKQRERPFCVHNVSLALRKTARLVCRVVRLSVMSACLQYLRQRKVGIALLV